VYKQELCQLVVPVPPKEDSAAFLLALLDDLVPVEEPAPVGS
jgi:hypothetical protein